MNSNMTEQLDQLFRMWDRGLCPGAQVLIRQHGKTLYEKCFGYGNLENKLKIHKESIFHVASISKEFTVMSILLLWKEGKLDLDDNIKKYLDEYINIETPITIRQMMNNVSGLRDQWELLFLRGIKINDQIDMDDINTTISLQKSLNFEPQSQYLYSNTGFHLLALIVEKLSQMSFPQFVKERIFTPLGMTHSFVRESFTQIVPDLTYSYQDEGDDTFYYNPLNYALYGPTSVNTCASDLCKVLDEYIHPNVIDPEIIELMKKPVLLSNGKTAEYCGGLITHKLHGLDVFGHGGADAAYRGEIICIPEKKLELVLISNTTTYAMSKLADKAACIVLGLPDCTEPAVPEHENAPARSGVFLTALPDDPMFVDITEQNGTFYMQREWCRTELVKEEDGGYRIGSLDEKIYFTDNEILYRLPGRVLTLTPAEPVDPALFQEGTYYNDETDSFMKLVKVGNTCEIHMRRYGKTTLYQSGSGSIIFRMDANLVMYVKAENDTIIMDGGRIKHILYQKQ